MILLIAIGVTILLGIFALISGKFVEVFSKKTVNQLDVLVQAIKEAEEDVYLSEETLHKLNFQLNNINGNIGNAEETLRQLQPESGFYEEVLESLETSLKTRQECERLYDEAMVLHHDFKNKLEKLYKEKNRYLEEITTSESLKSLSSDVENLKNKHKKD